MKNNSYFINIKIILIILTHNFTTHLLAQNPNFIEVTERLGDPAKQYRCKGATMVDYDQDGDDDIYITKTDGRNLLMQNLGNGTFVENASARGIYHGSGSFLGVWGDFDNDGKLDLYLGNYDMPDILYRNNGNGTFTNVSYQAGINNPGKTLTVNLADVDKDGFLDIFVGNFNEKSKLYKNNGDFTFTDIAQQVGLTSTSYTMGAVFVDYDNDNDPDLYITHDNNAPNLLYQNDGTGRFTNVAPTARADVRANGMGVDFGDINNDGLLDLYIVNLFPNNLLLNKGDGTFQDITASSQTGDVGMGWGTVFLDFNNDGRQDIYVTNDTYFTNNPKSPNVLYQNIGNNTFIKADVGLAVCSDRGSYGLATGDIDKDGFIDLVIANNDYDKTNQLFLNNNTSGNWFGITLEGTTSNRSAIGARVTGFDSNGRLHIDEVTGGSGYSSQNALTIHFGLGTATQMDSLVVRWPSGNQQFFRNVSANEYYTLKEMNNLQVASTATPLFTPTAAPDFNFSYKIVTEQRLEFLVELPYISNINISLYDITGRLLANEHFTTLPTGKHRLPLELATAPPSGMYLVNVSTKTSAASQKVVINHWHTLFTRLVNA